MNRKVSLLDKALQIVETILQLISSIIGKLRQITRAYKSRRILNAYLDSEQRPWSPGYHKYKIMQIRDVLFDQDLLDRFRYSKPLPSNYGYHLDCRIVEIPWVISHLEHASPNMRLLDAGSALNHEFVVQHPAVAQHDLSIITLAPERLNFWQLGISYIYDDMRQLPFRDNWFDMVVCISTLEHVGMDNSLFAPDYHDYNNDNKSYLQALLELNRVLRPRGKLYLTLPYGIPEDHGWLHQFDATKLDELIEAFDPIEFTETIYKYNEHGMWEQSTRISAASSVYFDYISKDIYTEMPLNMQAAEGAVVCLELVK